MKKKVCIALYGQPRLLEDGHRNIMNSISSYSKDEFEIDFLCHTYDYENTNLKRYSDCSDWSTTQHAKVEKNIEERIVSLYNPILYKIEEPFNDSKIDAYVDSVGLKDSLMWKNASRKKSKSLCTRTLRRGNYTSTISQMNSRKQLVNLYKKLDKRYDFVVCMRYDFLRPLDSDLFYYIDPFYLNTSAELINLVLQDNCLISNPDIFLKCNSIIDNIPFLINNQKFIDVCEDHPLIEEGFTPSMEHYLFCNLLYYYGNYNIIKKIEGIPTARFHNTWLRDTHNYDPQTGWNLKEGKMKPSWFKE